MAEKKSKPYKKRKYSDGSYVIYKPGSGAICTCDDQERADLVLTALNEQHDNNGK